MAKVRNNVIVRGLSGSFGDQMVLKIDKAGRTIVSNVPTFDENREFSPAQQAHQEKFREARVYAASAKDLPIYIKKAEGTPLSPSNVAMADWFHEPEIKEIDLSAWTGQSGEPIRIRAIDDVQVKEVKVVIADEADVLLEQGVAVEGENSWWTYTTTGALGRSVPNPKVVVSAVDLPGHVTQMTQNKN